MFSKNNPTFCKYGIFYIKESMTEYKKIRTSHFKNDC